MTGAYSQLGVFSGQLSSFFACHGLKAERGATVSASE